MYLHKDVYPETSVGVSAEKFSDLKLPQSMSTQVEQWNTVPVSEHHRQLPRFCQWTSPWLQGPGWLPCWAGNSDGRAWLPTDYLLREGKQKWTGALSIKLRERRKWGGANAWAWWCPRKRPQPKWGTSLLPLEGYRGSLGVARAKGVLEGRLCFPGVFGCCYSVAQSCLTLCHPMDCSAPDFSVLHQLQELA